MSTDLWLVLCFAFFCLSIALFAIIYYRLYRSEPQRFLFLQELHRSQEEEFRGAASATVTRSAAEIEALEALIALIQAGQRLHDLSDRQEAQILSSGDYWSIGRQVATGTRMAVVNLRLEGNV